MSRKTMAFWAIWEMQCQIISVNCFLSLSDLNEAERNETKDKWFLEFPSTRELVVCMVRMCKENCGIGGFHVTSSRLCWWTRTIAFSLAPFVRPPAFVHFTIVICVSGDWLQTNYTTGSKQDSLWITSSRQFYFVYLFRYYFNPFLQFYSLFQSGPDTVVVFLKSIHAIAHVRYIKI